MNKIDLGDELDIYAQHPDTYIEDINKLYSKNKVIEAFVLLHGLAEYKMNMIWPLSLIRDKRHYVKVKYWGFNDILNLFKESGLINQNLFSNLKAPQKCRYLTKQILQAKIESQINFLKLTGNEIVKDGISKLESCLANFDDHAEKKASMIYFAEFRKLIPDRYGFTARGSSFIRSNKKNATDVINALLNYGYTVLAGEISKFINGVGLDPYFGFNHRTLANSPALVYDLIEPFRWLVEYSVYKLACVNRIYKRDYAHTREGSIILGYDLIRKFLELLERNFRMERRIEFKHGAKTQDGLKAVQEITIAKITVQNLIDFCIGKKACWEVQSQVFFQQIR